MVTFRASRTGPDDNDWGLVPLVIETGDVLQLPAVAATACWDPVRAEVDTSDAVGRQVWDAIVCENVFVLDAVLRQVRSRQVPRPSSSFLRRAVLLSGLTSPCCQPTVVLAQEDGVFKTVLSNVHDGNANHDLEYNFLRGLALPNATEATKELFARNDGIVLAPTWKLCRPYTINTLVKNAKPVAVCRAKSTAGRGGNHFSKSTNKKKKAQSSSLHADTVIAEDIGVMCVQNLVVGERLINGALGRVVDITYDNAHGPRDKSALPLYVIVDFGEGNVTWIGRPFLDEDGKRGYYPVLVRTDRCEQGCCSRTQIPLVVATAMSIHKAQGMTTGDGHPIKRVLVTFGPEGAIRSRALSALGLTSVAFSRAVNERALAIAEVLSREDLQKIGSSPACHAAKQALQALGAPAAQTAARWQARMDAFDGGYDGLVEWYNERVREAGGNGQPAPVRPPRI